MKKKEAIEVIKDAVSSYEEALARHDSWYGEASPDEEAYLPWVEDLGEEVSSGELNNILLSIIASTDVHDRAQATFKPLITSPFFVY